MSLFPVSTLHFGHLVLGMVTSVWAFMGTVRIVLEK
jgi:hypothetical protein